MNGKFSHLKLVLILKVTSFKQHDLTVELGYRKRESNYEYVTFEYVIIVNLYCMPAHWSKFSEFHLTLSCMNCGSFK